LLYANKVQSVTILTTFATIITTVCLKKRTAKINMT